MAKPLKGHPASVCSTPDAHHTRALSCPLEILMRRSGRLLTALLASALIHITAGASTRI